MNKIETYPTLVDKALEFAVKKHAGQYRHDGSTPYIVHPIDVYRGLVGCGIKNQILLAASLTHDVIEDTNCTFEELSTELGLDVANLVIEVTKTGIDDKTILEKMAFIKDISNKSLEALILKIQDRYCNFKDYQRSSHRPWYAGYYALQAYPFMQTFISKIEEIKIKYGNFVSIQLMQILTEMDNVVYKQYDLYLEDTDKNKIMDTLLLNRSHGSFV